METEVLIVGGGLAGLSLADKLSREGVDFLLVEAQNRLGGRILTEDIGGGAFDLGPAWFWPGQPRMARLIDRFGLRYFEQYSTGDIVFQDQSGTVHKNRGYSSMQGSYRVAGGMGALITSLHQDLPNSRIRLNAMVTALRQTDAGKHAQIRTATGQDTVLAESVVLALPPRVIAQTIQFIPELPQSAMATLEQLPTWMAGQAKIVAVYDRPYWRDAGLSGDAMSHKGPMVEIHDASPVEGGPYALFGFVGFPAEWRAQNPERVLEMSRDQLSTMFGPEMAHPIAIRMQDWALNPAIATRKDQISPHAHPSYGLPPALADLWSGRLMMASTELGRQFGGLLEGALEVADETASQIAATRMLHEARMSALSLRDGATETTP
jgi:monoamine oxidase